MLSLRRVLIIAGAGIATAGVAAPALAADTEKPVITELSGGPSPYLAYHYSNGAIANPQGPTLRFVLSEPAKIRAILTARTWGLWLPVAAETQSHAAGVVEQDVAKTKESYSWGPGFVTDLFRPQIIPLFAFMREGRESMRLRLEPTDAAGNRGTAKTYSFQIRDCERVSC